MTELIWTHLEFNHMIDCFEDGLWYRNGNAAINMVETMEITGNWQDRANHNVQKFYETTMDRKENKQNRLR